MGFCLFHQNIRLLLRLMLKTTKELWKKWKVVYKSKISTRQNFMGYVFVKDLFIKDVRVGIIMY